MEDGGRAKGYFALFLTSMLWGTTWVASKIGLQDIGALQLAAIRQWIAGACMVVFFMVIRKFPLPGKKQLRWLILMSFMMFVIANGLSTWSLKFIPAGMSALIGALNPLCVVIIERIFFKTQKLKPLTVAGFLFGILGIGIVFYENAFHQQTASFLIGVSLSLTAMLSWSVGTVFIARNKIQMNPYYATGWQMVISSFILMLMAYFIQPVVPFGEITFRAWSVIIYLVFFGSIITFVAFIYSLKKLPVAIASLYAYFNPLVALVSGAVILHEKLTMYILWGALVTLTGVFLVNYSVRVNKKVIVESEI